MADRFLSFLFFSIIIYLISNSNLKYCICSFLIITNNREICASIFVVFSFYLYIYIYIFALYMICTVCTIFEFMFMYITYHIWLCHYAWHSKQKIEISLTFMQGLTWKDLSWCIMYFQKWHKKIDYVFHFYLSVIFYFKYRKKN